MKYRCITFLLPLFALLFLTPSLLAHTDQQTGDGNAAQQTSLPSQSNNAAQSTTAQLVQHKCTECHSTMRICAHFNVYDTATWEKTVSRMVEHGAKVDKAQQPSIVSYLAGPPADFPDCAPGEGVVQLGTWSTLLMLGHPLLMLLNICLALWVFFLGIQRFRNTTLAQRARFPWKTHVRYGHVVMIVFLLGMVAGPSMTALFWGEPGTSGTHFQNGLLMLPFIIVGLLSGRYLDRNKAKRHGRNKSASSFMPIFHGINNLVVLLLALCQLTTGAQMVFALLGLS